MQNGMLGDCEALRRLWGGLLLDLVVKLDGENGPEWETALGRFLRKENPWTTPKFKVWKTIKLGTGPKNADDFRKAIKDNGMRIGDYANDILGKPAFTVATEETELDLVVVSVAELGFKNGAAREQIYIRAKELGLDLCLVEVGPQLRLQYKDQPNGEWLVVAMDPITDSDGVFSLFYVARGSSNLWLNSYYDESDRVWGSGDRFVFSRRNSLCFFHLFRWFLL